ncbi:MAPK regulated corepressor interacting protein 2-like isoform X2 [Embiotoca jacksoni]|uniref:MAPK regulated corepressor interacting protein 2-like isoform X2 n=1 Tax=Embiotoca jacksoni TaxID=100190 RepID=UPI0037040604
MMYAITRGPSKLVTQRRTGPTQQLDKINDFKHKQTSWNMPDLPAAKIVFNRLNGKKYHHHPASALPASGQPEDRFTPAHQENVEFAYDAWREVSQREQGPEVTRRVVRYKETTTGPHVDDFVPLDLDEWWAQRFLANIDKPS